MSTRIIKKLSDEDIHKIQNGLKTAHCEIKKKIFSNLNIGDNITFIDSEGEKINVYITDVETYQTFEEFLKEHINQTGYYSLDIDLEAKRYRDELTNLRDEERYNVVGFTFKVIKEYQTPEKRRDTEFMS